MKNTKINSHCKTFSQSEKWYAIHLINCHTDDDFKELSQHIPALSHMGINVIILEVNYDFDYKSHPDLKRGNNPITKKAVNKLSKTCQEYNMRLMPQFQCLGHQSWGKHNCPLLIKYPEFDITPGAYPGNKDIYCREWDPMNPKINKIIFQLMDELIDAFEADAFHVGMDEVFLLGNEFSPSTKGKDPARLYAKVVNEIYGHIVKKHGLKMLMWGDRLIDGKKYDFGKWESALNNTAPAIDMIPKDIIICPWHYELKTEYPSIPMFIEKGFQVLPASWKNADAAIALINYNYAQKNANILGHIFTTWGSVKTKELSKFPALKKGMELISDHEKKSDKK